MGSIVSVFITAALGTWLAYVWQQRSAKQSRYFEASKAQFELMRQAASEFAEIIGRRLYATHRVCALEINNPRFTSAFDELVRSIEDWNNSYLKIELNVRTLFERSAASDLEVIQSRLAGLSERVLKSVKLSSYKRADLIHEVALIRVMYFKFLQRMIDEADYLFRQMHFGVELKYDRFEVRYFSNLQLLKALFSGAEDEAAVVRAPTDFGLPVSTNRARLRIN